MGKCDYFGKCDYKGCDYYDWGQYNEIHTKILFDLIHVHVKNSEKNTDYFLNFDRNLLKILAGGIDQSAVSGLGDSMIRDADGSGEGSGEGGSSATMATCVVSALMFLAAQML